MISRNIVKLPFGGLIVVTKLSFSSDLTTLGFDMDSSLRNES